MLDINNQLVAVLDKAFKIGYTKIKNNLWTCQFTMPLMDKKIVHIKPKYFIELYDHDQYIGKFIVNPKRTIKNESTNEITYQCEHVLSLLHSDVLFRYHQFSNFTTREVLEGLMDQQEVKHWKLGEVAFTRYFHYSWENEDSLLNAIFSVPKPFDKPYLWTWDDTTYPFTLNLVEPSNVVKDVIASGKNLKGIEIDEDPTNIVTRIYPLGTGEGVNQLSIEEVNNGIPYLENTAAREEYGIHKRVWTDMRFEDAESLKASAQAILDKFCKPLKSIAIDCRDYTLYERKRKRQLMAEYDVGDVLLVHDQDTNTHEEIRLEKIDKNDIYGAPQDIQFELGNVLEDISTTFSDLQKKQLVNETYSQGATNIDTRDYQDNCDPNYPAIIRFPIPDDVVNINEMTLTFETQPYRAYSRAIQGGGGIMTSTDSGGGTVVTSGDSGVDVQYGWGQTESANGHSHMFRDVIGHKHYIEIPNHNHNITLYDHVHGIEHGIFEYGSSPSEIKIEVDGNLLPPTATFGDRIDLIPYLQKDSSGKVERGRFAEIKLTPNNLARINATVSSRLFIQSRIGGVY